MTIDLQAPDLPTPPPDEAAPAPPPPVEEQGPAPLAPARALTRRSALFVGLALFGLLFSVYTFTNSGKFHIVDETSLFAVTESLGLRGALDTNAIAWTQWVNSPGEVLGAFGTDGQVYSKKGPAPAFLALPWYLLWLGIARLDVALGLLQVTLLWNGVVTALTAVLLWRTARRLGYTDVTGVALGLLFGLGTIAWPYANQYFGEPVSALSLLLCFAGILAWKQTGRWGWALAAGVGAGTAIATVTAHAVIVAIFGGYALAAAWQRARSTPGQSRRRELLLGAAAFAAPILLAGGLLLWYNRARFGDPLATGYHFDTGEGFSTPIWQGLWGQLFSPYRSVFLHTPLFLAGLAGFVPFVRRHRAEGNTVLAAGVTLILFYSAWWMWWGGYAWGPRFLVPMTPFWVLVLAPLVARARLRPGGNPRDRTVGRALAGLAVLSFLVQLAAVSVNFVNYETLLRTEFFPTDWADPLAFGPPAQGLQHLLLSPVFGQLRLILRDGLAAHSDLAWLWPAGGVRVGMAFVGLLAIGTFAASIYGWWRAEREPGGPGATPSGPIIALLALIPAIFTAAWLNGAARDPVYGAPGTGFRAVVDEICAQVRPGDVVVTVTPTGYHVPMNWLGAACDPVPPIYGYALNSLEHPEARAVLERTLGEAERILFVTEGVAPAHPDNTIERWFADVAYRADDRWFDDYRLERYATPGKVASERFTLHNLFVQDATGNGVTIVSSRVPRSAQPGDILPLDVVYLPMKQANADLRWFVQLLSAQGTAVAQLDTGPADNYVPFTALAPNVLATERAALQLPPDLPPGDYQVIVGLYNPALEGAPRLKAADRREYLVVSTLRVE